MHKQFAAVALLLGAAAASGAPAQTWRTVSSARQIAGEPSVQVKVEYGAGTLELAPAPGSLLYQMEARYDADRFEPVTEYDPATRQLRLGIRGEGRMRGARGGKITLGLAREVPIELDLEFGAGEADLELGDMALRRVEVQTGASETRIRWDRANRIPAEQVSFQAGAASLRASGLGNARAERFSFDGGVGETTLDFGGIWTRSATATIDMGVGALKLRFPRSLGVRINRDTFMTSFDADGMTQRGKSYFSRNWDTAAHRLTVDIDAAFGSIDVEWTDG